VASPALPGSDASEQLGKADRALWQELIAQLEAALDTLPDKPEETADATLRALWQLAAGRHVSARQAIREPLPSLDAGARGGLRALVLERVAGRPLAHLTERQSFMGVEMLAGPEALIPRRETELLGDAAVALVHRMAEANAEVIVVDICTGSGNLAAVLALSESRARVYASDISGEAVALARRNMVHLGIEKRVTIRVGDLLEPFDTDEVCGRVDLLTCNPPYISTGRMAAMPDEIIGHEPTLAFDGGPLGIRILQRLIRQAPSFVRPGGWLAFEVGLGQGRSVERRLRSSGDYGQVQRILDPDGQVRALQAQRRE